MRLALHPVAACAAALSLLALPAAASAQTGTGENITHVKNIGYPDLFAPSQRNAGTDLEFAEIRQRQYAFAGSYGDGVHAIDITDPENAELVGTWECGMSQADVQVFQREDKPNRWYATSTMDNGYTFHRESKCVAELRELGITVPANGLGTFIADVTNPKEIRTVGFIPVPDGASHNGTVHPSGKYFYNSNSDLITSLAAGPPSIEVFDITDVRKPQRVAEIPLKVFPGLGTESHDITFSADGKRAYSAALSHGAVIDTTDPAKPVNIGTVVDPAINVWHQADPVTIKDPILGERRFLVVEDEVAGASGTGQCPNGGVHVYDMTGELEENPVKVGYWNIDEARGTDNDTRTIGTGTLGTCTAHVFRLHEEEALMTIAYYNGGVRVVDLSGLVGVALGKNGVGMKQLGFYRFSGGPGVASDTWAVKAPFVSRDGFYLYGNDQNRGFDVYKYAPTKASLTKTSDTWLTPAAQRLLAKQHEARFGKPKLAAVCLFGEDRENLVKATRAAGIALPSGGALGAL
jgi:hypothetical protein